MQLQGNAVWVRGNVERVLQLSGDEGCQHAVTSDLSVDDSKFCFSAMHADLGLVVGHPNRRILDFSMRRAICRGRGLSRLGL